MQYPKLSERLGAALIDWLLYTMLAMGLARTLLQFTFGSPAMTRIVGFITMILATLLIIGYKVIFEAGRTQATPGKMVFGLKVVDANGARAGLIPVLLRTWPWWAFFITAITAILLVGYWVNGLIWLALLGLFFTFVLPPGGRCLHDITAGLSVVKAGPGLMGAR